MERFKLYVCTLSRYGMTVWFYSMWFEVWYAPSTIFNSYLANAIPNLLVPARFWLVGPTIFQRDFKKTAIVFKQFLVPGTVSTARNGFQPFPSSFWVQIQSISNQFPTSVQERKLSPKSKQELLKEQQRLGMTGWDLLGSILTPTILHRGRPQTCPQPTGDLHHYTKKIDHEQLEMLTKREQAVLDISWAIIKNDIWLQTPLGQDGGLG